MIKIKYDEGFGAIACCDDASLADELDDFLTEKVYVLYEVRFLEGKTEFLFGRASSVEALARVISMFETQHC